VRRDILAARFSGHPQSVAFGPVARSMLVIDETP